MALKRIIPCLLYDGSGLVKTIKFRNPSYVGDPINAIKIFNEKEVDELIILDINASKEKRKPKFSQIADMAGEAFMPFSYGGGVKTYEDFTILFKLGVEKVIVNSLIQENPAAIRKAVENFGSQAVVACIDVKRNFLGNKVIHSHRGHKIHYNLHDYSKFLHHELRVGELMIQSVDKDGTWEGYDIESTLLVKDSVDLPVIACGGCGKVEDAQQILNQIGVQAAAIGSMAVYSKKGMGVLINFPERNTIVGE
jgi:cyclase